MIHSIAQKHRFEHFISEQAAVYAKLIEKEFDLPPASTTKSLWMITSEKKFKRTDWMIGMQLPIALWIEVEEK